MVQEDDTSSPSGDKRRNKLGYQRTTVACGHCRRRKIRCLLPTPEDPQGRCMNCIRLKKECNFHPVDHPPDLRPGRKDSSSGLSPTSTSSPRTPAGPSSHLLLDSQANSPFDHQSSSLPSVLDDFNSPYINGTTNRSLSMPYMPGDSSSHLLQPSFTLSSTEEATEWANSPSFPHHPSSTDSQYWASGQNTPNTSTFPRHIGQHQQQQQQQQPTSAYGSPSLSYAGHHHHHHHHGHGSHSWAPSRSQSFSNFETLQQSYTYPELPPQPDIDLAGGTPLGYNMDSAPGSSTPSALGHHSPAPALLPEHGIPSAMGYGAQHAQQASWMPPDSLTHPTGSPWYAEPGGMIGPEMRDGGGGSGREGYSGMNSPVYPSRSGTG